ncbi:sugar ABC transporter ATP-binding protein [Testudinibacter sp. TR-2022]|uniref:sugar ABC transporter ATP-binding protein n=1 Tax=Testudinibacter sp. TR-2022 TaxID=2585029 RepID=UPI00111A5AA8|nr:sugar ABC transporter ATP-binding protein [Testudinibacter sp. TR-2022]TNH03250.1 sugar ABC transporter ATP-binding protein [Pasteurellaceae bacterium Phil31]TNH10917.1 sugar ABC transporter ATP-binding protein [Testudinibacter sp. TR-2022]TNH12284.1 sugar ABC transporter ATP-binding protein [Testudinibacter sp. TR-2022]TNH15022.1 sugar ABC transporter ATP-binding protein [Testudinibacter sp. TR-2022]TNH20497.1 sugar ABC transporter ATP-binding protein [Testudinibacter sp. TR-2022]
MATQSQAAPLLSMSNISKSFGTVHALKDVHLELRKGEVHALMGENGAGKSTLMKCLIGVYHPEVGDIVYKGEKVRYSSVLEAQKNGISMIFQELNLIPHLTVAENIFFAREPLKHGLIDQRKMNVDATQLLSMFDIDVAPTDIVHTLSVAKQQMVEIAKALSFDVEVLIMDEPTSALTEKEIDKLFELVHRLKAKGVCIVYISHRMEELKRICDHITIFRDGTYVSNHHFSDISMDQIITKMVGRSLDNHFPPKTAIIEDDIILSVMNAERVGVFKPLNFDLRRGEILGITGLVGAKRTELARSIFGADPLDKGEIYVHHKKVSIKNPSDSIKAGIAYLSEDRKLNGIAVRMCIRENITMASMDKVSSNLGIISTDAEVKASKTFVDKMEIKTPTVEQLVNNLSGGNQQKVVIGKWLFRDATVMIFDEPTRGIDVGAKYAIYQLLDELAANGVGIIVISSELPEVLGVSDRVIIMREGQMTGMLETKSTNQEEIMQYATGVKNMFAREYAAYN